MLSVGRGNLEDGLTHGFFNGSSGEKSSRTTEKRWGEVSAENAKPLLNLEAIL